MYPWVPLFQISKYSIASARTRNELYLTCRADITISNVNCQRVRVENAVKLKLKPNKALDENSSLSYVICHVGSPAT